MWDSILDAFGSVMAFFYGGIPNYGVTIILITVAIRLALFPLTAKQARSMAAMQRVQPEIKKIQQKYKHDRQKLNEELMAFYKEHQINPLAGCLPLVAQIPIFFALFQVLRSPSSHIPTGTRLFDAFCPQGAEVCAEEGAQGLEFLTMDLSRGANAAHGSVTTALPFFVLIALVVASGYFQSRQMTKMQRGRATAQSQMMTKIFPVFFGVISFTLPAGVVLYFLVSNVWQIGQQALVFGRDGGSGASKSRDGRSGSRAESGKAKSDKKADSGKPDSGKAAAIETSSRPTTDESTEKGAGKTDGSDQKSQVGSKASSSEARPNRSKSRKRKKRKRRR